MRRKGVRAVAVGLCSAVLAVSGCSATHSRPAARTTPSASAPSSLTQSDAAKIRVGGGALQRHQCRAHIAHGDLVAPFWIDNEHFDPARQPRTHTPAQVLAAYRANPENRGRPQRALHVAYADYSVTWRHSPSIHAWMVVSYGVEAMSSMSGPMRVDDVTVLSDQNLRSRVIIEALPTRCA